MKRAGGALILLLLTSCVFDSLRGVAATGTGGEGAWSGLPESPLSARYASHAAVLDGDLFIVGGTAADPCPPNAGCTEPTDEPFRDGAVYDPTLGTWKQIAEAPIPIGEGWVSVVRDRLYVLLYGYGSTDPSVRAAFLSYDSTTDAWEELKLPPGHDHFGLTVAGPQVVAFQTSQERGVSGDFLYDPKRDEWEKLRADPLAASFDRWMTWTDAGLVLTGLEDVPQPGSNGPAVYRAALLRANGTWERFEDSEIFGYNPVWSWTAGTLLNPSNERADGGETNNWGRIYHAGGTFDPTTGEWELLPDPPEGRGEFQEIAAAGDRYAIAYSGWVYDARDKRWLELPRPDGGPDGHTAAAWVGDELYVYGGVRWRGSEPTILNEGWAWAPAP